MRRPPYFIGIAILCSTILAQLNAQTPVLYQIESSNRAYESISGLPGSVNLTGGSAWDDASQRVIGHPFFAYVDTLPVGGDLPFPVTVFGLGMTEFDFCPGVACGGALSLKNGGKASVSIVPGDLDLADKGIPDTVSISDILMHVRGVPPSREIIFEWLNAGVAVEVANPNSPTNLTPVTTINFQIVLWEDSENIELRYGPSSLRNGSMFQLNLTAQQPAPWVAATADVFSDSFLESDSIYVLHGSTNAPQIQQITRENLESLRPAISTLDSYPESGVVYTFRRLGSSSVEDISKKKPLLLIHPNPTSSLALVQVKSTTTQPQVLIILDSRGSMILRKEITTEMVDFSELSKGVYTLLIENQPMVTPKRLVIN